MLSLSKAIMISHSSAIVISVMLAELGELHGQPMNQMFIETALTRDSIAMLVKTFTIGRKSIIYKLLSRKCNQAIARLTFLL